MVLKYECNQNSKTELLIFFQQLMNVCLSHAETVGNALMKTMSSFVIVKALDSMVFSVSMVSC